MTYKLHQRVYVIDAKCFGHISREIQFGRAYPHWKYAVRLDGGIEWLCGEGDLLPAHTPRYQGENATPSDVEPSNGAA